jgi:hypothetical protein
MGLFDGGLFDFNGDGRTDIFETGLGFAMLQAAEEEEKRERQEREDRALFLRTGYSRFELEWMSPEEKKRIFNEAGVDPMDYGFYDVW